MRTQKKKKIGCPHQALPPNWTGWSGSASVAKRAATRGPGGHRGGNSTPAWNRCKCPVVYPDLQAPGVSTATRQCPWAAHTWHSVFLNTWPLAKRKGLLLSSWTGLMIASDLGPHPPGSEAITQVPNLGGWGWYMLTDLRVESGR